MTTCLPRDAKPFCAVTSDTEEHRLVSSNEEVMTRLHVLGRIISSHAPLIAGFFCGILLFLFIEIAILPRVVHYWPAVTEKRCEYEGRIFSQNFSYRSLLEQYRSGAHYLNEHEFLLSQTAILCYLSDQEVEDAMHLRYILTTWAELCDKTILFYQSSSLLTELKKQLRRKELADNIIGVYVTGRNNTMLSAINLFRRYRRRYQWVVYVPGYVFLIPDNLR